MTEPFILNPLAPVHKGTPEVGAIKQFRNAWLLDTYPGQQVMKTQVLGMDYMNEPDEEGFDPSLLQNEMIGYESAIPDLLQTRSKSQFDAMKRFHDENVELRRQVDAGSLMPRFMAGFLDPINLIPIPLARGVGFMRGAVRGGLGVGAASGATEFARTAVDPSVSGEDAIFPIAAASLFGAALGGGVSVVTRPGFRAEAKSFFEGIDVAGAKYDAGQQKDGLRRGVDSGIDIPQMRRDEPAPEAVERTPVKGTDRAVSTKLEEVLPEDLKAEWPRTPGGRLRVDKKTIEAMAKKDTRIVPVGRADLEVVLGEDLGPGGKAVDDVVKVAEMRSTDSGRQFKSQESTEGLPNMSGTELINEKAALEVGIRRLENTENTVGAPGRGFVEAGDASSDFVETIERQLDLMRSRLRTIEDEMDFRSKGGLRADNTPAGPGGIIATRGSMGEIPPPESVISLTFSPDDPFYNLDDLVEGGSWIGKAMAKSTQFPYFTMKFNKLPGTIHRMVARMADEIAGDPGMTLVGNALGHANAKSVATFAMAYRNQYRIASEGMRAAWMKMHGLTDSSFAASVVREQGDNIRQGLHNLKQLPKSTKEDFEFAEGRVSFQQFSEEAVRSWIRNGGESHEIPEIAEAAKSMGQFFQNMGKEAEKFGVFGENATRRNLERKTEILARKEEQHAKWWARRDEAGEQGNIPLIDSIDRVLDDIEIKIAELQTEIKPLQEAVDGLNVEGIMPASERFYFARTWRLDKIDANEEGLRGAHREWFQQTGHGTPAEIEARVSETMAMIRGEAQMLDADGSHLGMITRDDVKVMRRQTKEDIVEKMRGRMEEVSNDPDLSDAAKDARLAGLSRAIGRVEAGEFTWKPRPAMTRQNNIPNDMVFDFIETNPELVMLSYVQRMGPAIEMSRKFGDMNLELRLEQLDDMVNEARLLGGDDPVYAGLDAEWALQRDAIMNLRDVTLGIYGVPADPSSLTNRALSTSKALMVTTKMGRAWQASIADVGRTMLSVGVTPFIKHALGRSFASDIENLVTAAGRITSEGKLIREEMQLAAGFGETAVALRTADIMGLGGPMAHGTAIERWIRGSTGSMMVANLLAPWTDLLKRWTGGMIQSNIIKYSRMRVAGELDEGSQFVINLNRAGIDLERSKKIVAEWEAAGAMRGDNAEFLANTAEWGDDATARIFRAAMIDDVNSAVITPGAADKPLFMTSPVWSTVLQFKQFPMSATARFTMSALQQQDYARAYVMQGVMASIVLGYMVGLMRDTDFNKESIFAPGRFLRAIDMSGSTGIFTDINNIIESVSGDNVGIRPALGIEPFIDDPSFVQRAGSVLGPSFSTYAGLIWAFTSPDADVNDRARAVRYIVPFNNVWLWSNTVSKVTRDTASALEE